MSAKDEPSKPGEQLPMPEVKITAPYHLRLIYEYLGAMSVVDKLEKLAKQFPKFPGIGLALATARLESAQKKSFMLARHLKVAIKHGFDPDTETLSVIMRKDDIFLAPQPADEDAE